MKKRVVAILLILTMCSSMVTEAGAAAMLDSAVESYSENSFSDSESDVTVEEEPMVDGETETPEDTDGGNISIEDPEGEMQQPSDEPSDNTDSNDVTDNTEPEVGFADDLFSSGDNMTESEQKTQTVPEMENTTAEPAAAFETEDAEKHTATLLYTRWKLEEGNKWMLQKLPKTRDTVVGNENAEVLDGTAADEGTVSEMLPDIQTESQSASAETDDEPVTTSEEVTDTTEAVNLEGDMQGDTEQLETIPEVIPDVNTVPETEDNISQENVSVDVQDAKESVEYYRNTLVEITTVDSRGQVLQKGTYYFNENGCMLTGKRVVNPGTEGFPYDSPAEYFFQYSSSAKVTNPDTEAGDTPTPFNSNMGQMQKNTGYMWDAGAFHKYGEDGRAEEIAPNMIYKIGGQFYYLLEDGKPYIGVVEASYNGRKGLYAFRKSEPGEKVPGKMVFNRWASMKTSKGDKWLFFGSNGLNQKKGAGVYKLLAPSKNTEYLIDSYGYLAKDKVIKAANGSYYMANKYGWVYKDSVVKWNNARYYFGKDGKRVEWTKRWIRVHGNKKGRYYYIGSIPGRIQEMKGIQNVTMNGKHVGWFLFDSNGENVQSQWSGDRYFLGDGRMASGPVTVGDYKYFFERSSSTQCRGKKYKSQWIKYNNKFYYATKEGRLYGAGWKTINGNRYYFEDWTAVTNVVKKDPDTKLYGYLDSRGKFTTEWIAHNNSKNNARYVNPQTGAVYKNMTKTIDGVNYRFDKYGNRVNDRTSEFKRSNYYLECDRVNGVMTIYTDSSKKTPIKTIRVSVGLPETPTKVGTFKITRADRWQLLMGPSWGQYGSHVVNGIYIHSVASGQPNGNNLPAGEYLKLGNPASHGCIRCCVADAKWIWENCNGSTIRVFDGKYKSDECFKGPLGRNPLTPLRGSGTFDPTDPNYN